MIKLLFLGLFLLVQASTFSKSQIVKSQVDFKHRLKRSPQPEGIFGAIRDIFRTFRGEVNGEREVKKNRVFKLFFGRKDDSGEGTPDPDPDDSNSTPSYHHY